MRRRPLTNAELLSSWRVDGELHGHSVQSGLSFVKTVRDVARVSGRGAPAAPFDDLARVFAAVTPVPPVMLAYGRAQLGRGWRARGLRITGLWVPHRTNAEVAAELGDRYRTVVRRWVPRPDGTPVLPGAARRHGAPVP